MSDNKSKYEIRTTAWAVGPAKEPLFSEMITSIRIEDEAAGEFLILSQEPGGRQAGELAISPEEWPLIRDAIDNAIKQCRDINP